MNINEKIAERINKLDLLTMEAGMLTEALYESLLHKESEGQDTSAACCLLEIIRGKFRKIRELF